MMLMTTQGESPPQILVSVLRYGFHFFHNKIFFAKGDLCHIRMHSFNLHDALKLLASQLQTSMGELITLSKTPR